MSDIKKVVHNINVYLLPIILNSTTFPWNGYSICLNYCLSIVLTIKHFYYLHFRVRLVIPEKRDTTILIQKSGRHAKSGTSGNADAERHKRG